MEASLKSLIRFTQLVLRIGVPAAHFHQTLTFAPVEDDFDAAKRKLNKLLSNIHHQNPEMASFYVGEPREEGGYHFHLFFLFFVSVSATKAQHLSSDVWQAWSNLNDGSLVRRANRFKRSNHHFSNREHTLWYFTKWFPNLPRRWYGSRNLKRFNEGRASVSSKSAIQTLKGIDRYPVSERERKRFKNLLPVTPLKERMQGLF